MEGYPWSKTFASKDLGYKGQRSQVRGQINKFLGTAVSFEGNTWYLCKLYRWVGSNILTKTNNNWGSKGQRSWVKGQISGFLAKFCVASNSKSTRPIPTLCCTMIPWYMNLCAVDFGVKRSKVKGHRASDLF